MKNTSFIKKNASGLHREVSAIALALVITPLILAGNNRICKAITAGTQVMAACQLLPNGNDCAAPNYVCGVRTVRRTCFDGGTEYCSEGFLGFGGNCNGRYPVHMVCTYVQGYPSVEGHCYCR
jgi:hypothetical protein